jgi:hypothetical protein
LRKDPASPSRGDSAKSSLLPVMWARLPRLGERGRSQESHDWDKKEVWTMMLLLVSMVLEPPCRGGYRGQPLRPQGSAIAARRPAAALDPGASAAPGRACMGRARPNRREPRGGWPLGQRSLLRIRYVFRSSQCLQGRKCSSNPTSGTVFPQVRGFLASLLLTKLDIFQIPVASGLLVVSDSHSQTLLVQLPASRGSHLRLARVRG